MKDFFKKGVLVISVDTEMAWGRLDHPDLQRYFPLYEKTPRIVERLLATFERHQTPATWALVGRLMVPGPSPSKLIPEKFLDGSRILEAILRSPLAHEIACHTFSHALFDAIPREKAEEELGNSVEAASRWGLTLRSLVFPRNRVGHLDLLPGHGLVSYRHPDRAWHERFPQPVRTVLRQFESVLALPPQATLPRLIGESLVVIDGHLPFFIPYLGYKSRLPASNLVLRAQKGLRAAQRQQAMLHLWLHPHDFAHRSEEQLTALDAALTEAARMREQGRLTIATMAEIASVVLNSRPHPGPAVGREPTAG